MCGIAGYFNLKRDENTDSLRARMTRMNDSITHRGPDGSGVWVDGESGIALGQRRLAIIDLSPAGAQPMHSADGRYVITYNGEVYNYRALAAELRAAGHTLTGEGDTAAMLAGIATWGLPALLQKLDGIFAFALWDKKTRTLTLARDRSGIKPLYWCLANGNLLFGSELRALRQHPACPTAIDRAALVHYFRCGNVPAPQTILRDVQKLPPAHYLTITATGDTQLTQYWNLQQIANTPVENPPSYHDASEQLHQLLQQTVRDQMLASDVPIGALLSGGIDSSTVAALMQSQSSQPIKTFSIGFAHDGFDEAPQAKRIAAHLGTSHTEAYVTEADARAVIPQLPAMFDEPFADSSQIPTYLVSKMARQHVTVALSGDGGDEVFLGYNRYASAASFGQWPLPVRQAAAFAVRQLTQEQWNQLSKLLPQRWRHTQLGDKLHKLAAYAHSDIATSYQQIVSWWQHPEMLVQDAAPVPLTLAQPAPRDPVAAMQLWDLMGYLHDDVLTKVDRASMAVALEVRVPLLDHKIIEWSLRLPVHYKLQHGVTKRLLRDTAYRYIPRAMLERPKSGFAIPLSIWLRGPLRQWAEDWLTPASLQDAGLNPTFIRTAWENHLSKRNNHQYGLWAVLMYLGWRKHWQTYE